MIDRRRLLADLKRQVRRLEEDLREEVARAGEARDHPRAEYAKASRVGRTAATWEAWRDERVTQAAASWVLGTVFVRFCEDNGLLEQPYFAGPTTERMTLAEERQEQFFRDHPEETDRGWLLVGFDAIQSAVQSGTTANGNGVALFSKQHNPLYQIPVSHDAAKALIAFWRSRGEDGRLVHDFTDPEWDTRFLGDLYQDLSEAARKNYALLQTPEFVEEFILDLTLTPAIEEFGFEEIKLIDPTCGSGHFLLGAFHRLVKEWEEHAPARDAHERVRLALEAVHGVDINPFAVAIARFRLLVAALSAAGFRTLGEAAGYSFPVKIAVGDSLIKARQLSLYYDKHDRLAEFAYETEDLNAYPGILEPGRYHVAVGNPPYVTVKDNKLSTIYRKLYDACAGKYALSVPFAQRLFELARRSNADDHGAGYVGQITANSFMKREFGKKLIEEFFARRVELTHIIDTSGAYIPGHGTPTVILVGRGRDSRRAPTVRAVMSIRGEPGVPIDPAMGLVWQAIIKQVHDASSESEWVSVAEVPRERFSLCPWSLSGGAAPNVLGSLQNAAHKRLVNVIDGPIGFYAITGDDDVYVSERYLPARWSRLAAAHRGFATGDTLRDWNIATQFALWPYTEEEATLSLQDSPLFWPFRTRLRAGLAFGKTRDQRGMAWHEYTMLSWARVKADKLISFACVSTHNHFALSEGGAIFNRHTPVIKLLAGSSANYHLGLLGLLNSSTACFWLKQVSHNKGSTVDTHGARQTTIPWEDFYEFTGTKLEEFPLPKAYPLEPARQLDTLAQRLAAVTPASLAATATPTRDNLAATRSKWHSIRARMIALQEELDWHVYALYGLLSEELTAPSESVPDLQLGERAFEIVLARKMAIGEATTEWFTRHGSMPITEIPAHWPDDYKALVEKRIAVIENNRHLALIERPECKRRWATDGWDKLLRETLRGWLLDRLETRDLWYHEQDGVEQPRAMSTADLAHELRRDRDVLAVAHLYAHGKDFPRVIEDLVADEQVPYLAALRYKESGLAKRAQWEQVWDLQRQEDAADTDEQRAKIRAQIPVPTRYKSSDFRRPSYWRHRGKLDVPKERFISYPAANRKDWPSLLLGWAGWNHREQAHVLVELIEERVTTDHWSADRLVPLLAGLREILPWVRQWHGKFDPVFRDKPAEHYAWFLANYGERLGITEKMLDDWRPPKASRSRKKRT